MPEKGGKGVSLSKGVKTALKSPRAKEATPKGKEVGPSKRGRKPKPRLESPNSEASPKDKSRISSKTGGKVSFETPVDEGERGKGGKDDNGKASWGKGGKYDNGKGSTPREPIVKVREAELNIEEELPKNAKCLMDCEAAVILQGIQDNLAMLSEDPAIKMPDSFNHGFQYAKTGSHYTSPESVRRVLETLKVNKVSEGELCMIGNVLPETSDEVFALIPSLKAKRQRLEGPITDLLYELAKHKKVK
eukprot:TRINITY_DN8290_c0_g1_i1.p1 TRINITY_DN8290_c0_g1~~TRINITY_DN8290_c0_g1_i1.p1  ORF type:complete len:247 (+),score=43.18 TRINITY_DN8290_c0_g1_i1:78-818(+)